MITRRTLARTGALGLAGAIAAPRIARGETPRWRMVTSWPKRLPGPGMSAERVAERYRVGRPSQDRHWDLMWFGKKDDHSGCSEHRCTLYV
jgi:hypothetical protein